MNIEKCPFFCSKTGLIEFPFRAIRDIVFIYPDPLPLFVGKEKVIHVAPEYQKHHLTEFGYVLTTGPGYYDNKRWIPNDQILIGSRVVYDKTIPWMWDVKDSNGVIHGVKVMGARDLFAVADHNENT